ncbi:MAG: AAA family ATPase, partial [Prochlorothrix sp.]
MLKTLSIDNFRGFKHFELKPLGQINLLVGANNSGKTSILEAIYLLMGHDPVKSLEAVCQARGEVREIDGREPQYQLFVHHLFRGHQIRQDSPIQIQAQQVSTDEQPSPSSGELEQPRQPLSSRTLCLSVENDGSTLSFQISRNINHDRLGYERFSLREAGSIFSDVFRPLPHTFSGEFGPAGPKPVKQPSEGIPIQWIQTLGLSRNTTIQLFEEILLTPEEEIVLSALSALEPNLQRIAQVTPDPTVKSTLNRDGFMVKLKDIPQPVPISSMGEGVWRILGLALAIVNAKDGILLVDEVDIGLHFTAMTEMWQMLCKTAQDFNVQVFATTHSRDCWQSL